MSHTALETHRRAHDDPLNPIVVGLSGGVDSSVAALLLKRAGHPVQAVFMKNWEEDDDAQYCAAAADLRDAERVCARLDIELRTVNFSHEYWEHVFEHFLAEHRAHRTPNPDVWCNREVKFKPFLDFAANLGAHSVATGHYARIIDTHGRLQLLKGSDPDKDQSYFLHRLDQTQLARAVFPLGAMSKHEVRALAKAEGLAVHAKKDSTGLCFIGERPFRAFLEGYLEHVPGPMETPDGETLGSHDGLSFYTIGQRKGLRIGGRQRGRGTPWYVAGKQPERNALIVVQGHDHPALFAHRLVARDVHWISPHPATLPARVRAKIRYRQNDQPCVIHPLDGDRCVVRFEQAQWAVAPGQSVVFYAGQECLGGGVIEKACHDADSVT